MINLRKIDGGYFDTASLPKFMSVKELADAFASKGLKVTADRVREFVATGKLPCFILDGDVDNPAFIWRDVQGFVMDQLMWRQEGAQISLTVHNIVLDPSTTKTAIGIPAELIGIPELYQLSSTELPAVYFLCAHGRVVYVGQSRILSNRISQHRQDMEKIFDKVFYMLVPKSELDRVEREMIAALKPRYNVVHNRDVGPDVDQEEAAVPG